MLPRFHPAWLQFAARLDVYIIWLQDAFAAVAGLHRPGSLNVRLLLLIIACLTENIPNNCCFVNA